MEGILFDADAVTNSCTANDRNCYIVTSCTLSGQGDDTEVTATCSATMWFNANASNNWEVHVNPTDGLGKVTSFGDTNVNITNPALLGIDMLQASLPYGTLTLGKTSVRQPATMQNVGNQPLDIMLDGDTMCTDYPACSGNTIPVSQQKWYHTDSDFNWSAPVIAQGPYTLVDVAGGTDDETGCLNRDIPVRSAHDNTVTNESIWFKLQIPLNQATGTYTGQNTFTATSASTCSSAQSY